MRRRRRQRTFRLGNDLKQMAEGLFGDLDRNGLAIVLGDIFFSKSGKQAIERAMGRIGRNSVEHVLSKGLEGLQAMMLARQPVVEFTHDAFSLSRREESDCS